MTASLSLSVPTSFGDMPLTAAERGEGRPVVILHGGAGPVSVTGFADLLAGETGTRVIVTTHPGFGGTPRPEALTSIGGLAELYAGLLDSLELTDAIVIGNSMGGWIAAELALLHPARLGGIAIADGVGIEVEGHPVAGSPAPAQLAEYSWYDPSKAPSLDPDSMPAAVQQIFAGNRAALALYGGGMSDPTLRARLGTADVPALALWGEADRIADADYGRAFAAAIPGARFELLPRTGHVPQMETPDVLLDALRAFVGK
ncbi:MAG TPA: alpha/beta hydrolase [Galbitalea sp.]